MQSSSYYKLILTMLTISFVSECRLWKACLTTVWHSFQANTCSKKSSAKLFWVYWSERRTGCGRSTTSFGKILIYELFAAVKLKQREKNVALVASPWRMLSMIKLKQWFFKTILYQNINYSLNCNYQLSTLCRVIVFSYTCPSCFYGRCFPISLCVLQIYYLTSLLPIQRSILAGI